MLRKSFALAAAVGLTLAAVPATAQQAPASRLSVQSSVVRTSAAHNDANKIGGGSTIIAILAAIAVAVGIAIAVKKKSP